MKTWNAGMTRAERREANKAAWARQQPKTKRGCAEREAAWNAIKAEHRAQRAAVKSDAPLPDAFRGGFAR
jgi:hypothetical protein